MQMLEKLYAVLMCNLGKYGQDMLCSRYLEN